MKIFNITMPLIIAIICVGAIVLFCQSNSREVMFFKNTDAYELAKAVVNEDLYKIETLVKENPKRLEVASPICGSNVIEISIFLDKYKSFKKLLELGANPNFINPIESTTLLVNACKFLPDYKIDTNYLVTLLNYGADPNYGIENQFTDARTYSYYAKSPLGEASWLSLAMVKILIAHGGNPYKILNKYDNYLIYAIESKKIDIVNYYLDSFHFDVHKPCGVLTSNDTLNIQDIAQKYLNMAYVDQEQRDTIIKKLEALGVDFKNYKYVKGF